MLVFQKTMLTDKTEIDDTGIYQLLLEKTSSFPTWLIHYTSFGGDGQVYLGPTTPYNYMLSSDNPMLWTSLTTS